VAEVITFGSTTLAATGLGTYITQATAAGDFARWLIGVAVMSVYVVLLNRACWQPLYRLAGRRYTL
jgi:NitT/TauT family transport system permease protein